MEKIDVALSEIRKMSEHISDIDIGLEKDRQNMSDLTVAVQQLMAEMAEVRRQVGLTPRAVQDRVAEVVEPVIESNQVLKEAVEKKKFVFVTEAKSWWQKLLRGGGKK
jgi:hypothetical protein